MGRDSLSSMFAHYSTGAKEMYLMLLVGGMSEWGQEGHPSCSIQVSTPQSPLAIQGQPLLLGVSPTECQFARCMVGPGSAAQGQSAERGRDIIKRDRE